MNDELTLDDVLQELNWLDFHQDWAAHGGAQDILEEFRFFGITTLADLDEFVTRKRSEMTAPDGLAQLRMWLRADFGADHEAFIKRRHRGRRKSASYQEVKSKSNVGV